MRAFCLASVFVLLSTSLTTMALPALSRPQTVSVEDSGVAERPVTSNILPRVPVCSNPLDPNCCGGAGC
ncbi:hypothetical protein PM082_019253 [Marasmius tenuissimus]|nr:hypothetical protein PM082_019253 [Marasmius tenuissimus]